ncbi:YHS domain-containing (seleno)protein [Nitratireductor sp. XY-223]|uniref:YHS domain-containing (seleno)protein n=1 Tax=Nitratireductor sp. XY-223 TaxID=2561926 RepID=UPI0010AB1362|nr:YHS domain-containing (seleno)protein [Nitratireductor sp. XY-223]
MFKVLKTTLAGVALSAALLTSALAAGVDVNATTTGLALRGYDPVAYFTKGAPTPGDFQITAEHNGATYRFANEENKALFVANPDAYAPAYGGYCAFGTAMGFKFDGDPELWRIVDNKLYLNLAPGIQERWEADRANLITAANEKWDTISDKTPEELQTQ